MAIDLDATLILPTASRYPFPQDGVEIIPLPYGDFLSTLVIPTDSDDGGFLPATEIDRLNWVFALSAKAVPTSPPPQIFVGDHRQPQDASVYSWVPAGDYGGIGSVISYIQFHIDPGSRKVSWRGQGIASGGVMIDNPLSALFDVFSTYGGWTLDDIDWATSYETFRTLTTLGAQIHWCFAQERTYRDWLNEMLRCYHVDYFENAEGKLAMVLDRGILGLSVTVLQTIDAQTDLEGTEDDVEFEVDEANICNTLTVRRRLKWTSMDYTDEPVVDHRPSVGLYGVLRDTTELPALYTDTHGMLWVQAFFGRYSYLPAIVRFTVRGLGYAPALPGTYLGFLWPWMGWTQARLLKVLNQDVDPLGQRISFEAFDCGRFVTDAVTLPTSTITPVRRRIRVPDTTVDLVPPPAATNLIPTGSFRRIVLRWTPPSSLDYDHTEIWYSTTNNRATAVFVRNGGYRGTTCEETFEVLEGITYYVWLMTVDQAGNGKDGGSGPTGGNWYPLSATAGVVCTSTLIPTEGIANTAVTLRITGGATLGPGTYTGETMVQSAFLGGANPTGDVRVVGRVQIVLGVGHILIMKIYRTLVGGALVGIEYQPNAVTFPATVDKFCHGDEANPVWPGIYVMTIQAIATDNSQQSWQYLGSRLDLFHAKK